MSKLTIKEQIKGLELIIFDTSGKERTIGRDYVLEKLEMIRKGKMNFHPKIIEHLLDDRKAKQAAKKRGEDLEEYE